MIRTLQKQNYYISWVTLSPVYPALVPLNADLRKLSSRSTRCIHKISEGHEGRLFVRLTSPAKHRENEPAKTTQ